jgi:hypothetical protein
VNTNHNSTAPEQDFVPWLERCKMRFGADFRAVGSGRYCLTTVDDAHRGWLFETRAEAEAMIADPKRCKITDLAEKTGAEKWEEVGERAERRRQRNVEALALVQGTAEAQGMAEKIAEQVKRARNQGNKPQERTT